MNTSFTQKYIEEIPIPDFSMQEFINLSVKTCKALGWAVCNVYDSGFTAYTANGTFNWNAEIKLEVASGRAKFISQSRNIRSIEIDKDKENLEGFLAQLNALKNTGLPVKISPSYMNVA